MHANLRVCRISIAVIVFFVARAFFETRAGAQTNQSNPAEAAEETEPLPISQVVKYLDTARRNTTLTDGRIRQRLVGHVYKGIVEVSNVSGIDKSLNVSAPLGKNGNAFFKISKPEIIKKVAELPKGAKVLVTAKLFELNHAFARFEAESVDLMPAETQVKETAPAKKAEAAEVMPMSQVTEYMAGIGDNTTIKNKQIAKRLVGRVFKGTVEVFDVDGDDISLTVTSRFPSERSRTGNWARFEITKPEVIKKAAELPRGANISITAKLSYVGTDRGGGASQASFNETQSVEIVPAGKAPVKN
jgi:hypothetical protein